MALTVRPAALDDAPAIHALLNEIDAFGAFAGLGRDTVGLGVDAENTTGALRLYEANGMRVHFAVDTWEITLPV